MAENHFITWTPLWMLYGGAELNLKSTAAVGPHWTGGGGRQGRREVTVRVWMNVPVNETSTPVWRRWSIPRPDYREAWSESQCICSKCPLTTAADPSGWTTWGWSPFLDTTEEHRLTYGQRVKQSVFLLSIPRALPTGSGVSWPDLKQTERNRNRRASGEHVGLWWLIGGEVAAASCKSCGLSDGLNQISVIYQICCFLSELGKHV